MTAVLVEGHGVVAVRRGAAQHSIVDVVGHRLLPPVVLLQLPDVPTFHVLQRPLVPRGHEVAVLRRVLVGRLRAVFFIFEPQVRRVGRAVGVPRAPENAKIFRKYWVVWKVTRACRKEASNGRVFNQV